METRQLTVGVVYNTNGEPHRGEPRDIIAIQETVEIAESIGEALSHLGYPYKKLPVRTSLDDLRRSLEPFLRSIRSYSTCVMILGAPAWVQLAWLN
jgi:hypothetical protein